MKLLIQIIQSILLSILMHLYICEPFRLKCDKCPDFPQDQIRELRYEYFKNFILKKMHLSKAPETNLPKPSRKSLLAVAEMAKKQTNSENTEEQKTDSVIIYPENANHICVENESPFCSRLQFSVSENLFSKNFVSAEVWFYKPTSNQSIQVHQILTNLSQNLTNNVELNNFAKVSEVWRKYNVSKHDLNAIIIEVTDESGNNADAVSFLIIRSKVEVPSNRMKRSITCADSITSCCKENFFLNFSDIGWDDWILHPEGYQANFCRGRCFNDLSNSRFYHSSVLLSYIRDNKDIAEDIGLSMCCTPSIMAPLAIIYRNEEGFIFHKIIDNMTVEECDCA